MEVLHTLLVHLTLNHVLPRRLHGEEIVLGGIAGALSGGSQSVTNNANEWTGLANFSCSAGTYTVMGGATCTASPVSGSITSPANGSSCVIADGASTCLKSFTWTTTNPVNGYTSQIVADNSTGHDSTPANNSTEDRKFKRHFSRP